MEGKQNDKRNVMLLSKFCSVTGNLRFIGSKNNFYHYTFDGVGWCMLLLKYFRKSFSFIFFFSHLISYHYFEIHIILLVSIEYYNNHLLLHRYTDVFMFYAQFTILSTIIFMCSSELQLQLQLRLCMNFIKVNDSKFNF